MTPRDSRPRSRRSCRPSAALVALLVFAPATACTRQTPGPAPEPARGVPEARAELVFQTVRIDAGGRAREFLLRVPAGAPSPMPLVVSLHGAGGHAAGVEKQSGWAALADREGVALAYPDGIGKTWNDGRADTPSLSVKENVEDVAFLTALIEDVATRAPIDRKRVYMNGISNGAFMTSRFACERGTMVAAIGLVAGTIGPYVLASCKPARSVSVIAFSGTADPIVPYEGGFVRLGVVVRGKAVSFEDNTRLWAGLAACATPPERSTLPNIEADDGSTARLEAFACPNGAAVHAYTVLSGGHTWPGGQQYLPRLIIGPVNRDLDATKAMWAFFAAHPAP